LHTVDGGITVKWKSDINMNDVAAAGASRSQSQTNPDVLEPTQGRLADRVAAPGSAGICKNRAAHPKQLEGIPVRKITLLSSNEDF